MTVNNEVFKIIFDRASEDIEEDDFEAVQRNTEILKSVSYSSFYIIFLQFSQVIFHCHWMRPYRSVRTFLFSSEELHLPRIVPERGDPVVEPDTDQQQTRYTTTTILCYIKTQPLNLFYIF